MNAGKNNRTFGYVLTVLLLPLLIIMIYPFLYMVASSFKDPFALLDEGLRLIPKRFTLAAYRTVFIQGGFLRNFLNSSIVSVVVVAGNTVFSPMAGYAFAKKDFPGKKFFFILLLSTMMIPIHLTLIPLYKFFIDIKWINTYQVLIIPFLAMPLGIFLMRQYIHGLPNELGQAARIDGCSEAGIFWRIIYPLTGPAMAVLVINTFLNIWNSYIWPFIFTNRKEYYTLTVAVAMYPSFKAQAFNEMMVTATVAMLPTAIVFLIFQRHIISGLTAGAVKG